MKGNGFFAGLQVLAMTLVMVSFISASASISWAAADLSIDPYEVYMTGNGYVLHVQNTGEYPSNVLLGAFHPAYGLPIGLESETTNAYAAVHGLDYGYGTGVYGQSTSGYGVYGKSTSGYAGYFEGNVYVGGNIALTGTLTKGADTFTQPHPSDPAKEVVYAVIEGPEHAVFYRGTANLKNGKAVIETPEYFRVVAGNDGITVSFTPSSEKSKGLAAVSVKKERVEVRELMKGKGNYEFDYFITAKRAGFEAHKPIQENRHFSADKMSAGEFEKRYAKTDDMASRAMRELLISNGILNADGRLNFETASRLGWLVKDSDVAHIELKR